MGRTLWCDDEGLRGLVERRGDVRHLGPLAVAEAVVHLRLRADEAQDRLGHALHTTRRTRGARWRSEELLID